jgi:hypothetical protein
MWNEVVLAYFNILSKTVYDRIKINYEILTEHSRSEGQDLNSERPDYDAGSLIIR